ncbi:hypothetical protein AM587_10013791 [Phytophthora nicotianae]|uniref:Acyltransferase 3 domain-containing protein n=1 Tax=Phytophthora nicotianae TaxID=4792 RepID=A0A0W8BYH8_PHYNI|nr:hypothetical protein AM587_10013791 [Phytophthora nicotianae]
MEQPQFRIGRVRRKSTSGRRGMLSDANHSVVNMQDIHTHLSVCEIPDTGTSIPTTKPEDQTFLGHTHLSAESSTNQAPAIITGPANGAHTKVVFLDGVRGLAAILVVIQHSHEYPTQGLHLGSVAVDAFFVLSSFLLTWLFLKKSMKMIEQQAGIRLWTIALLDYFQKRFFRVYPLFAVTAISLYFMPLYAQHRYFHVKKPEDYDLGKVLMFYSGFRVHVFWTLPLEIGYYFVIPMFVLAALGMRRLWWVGAVPLLVWIMHEGFYTYRIDHMPLAPHLHTFLAGSLGAVVFVKADMWIKETRFKLRWWHKIVLRVVEGLSIALLLSVSFQGLFFDWIHQNPVPAAPGFAFVSVQMTAVFVIEMICPSCISTMFEWSVLRYWGKISFSVYLLHSFVVYHPAIKHQKKYFNRFFARFGLILLLATVTYHLIEYPSQLLAQRISRFLTARGREGWRRFTCMEHVNLRKEDVPSEEK